MNIVKTEDVNTNNGWGFGGWSGKISLYDNGIVSEIGRNSHRHTGTSTHNNWYVMVHDDFRIQINSKTGFGKHITNIPKEDVYIYKDGTSYRAVEGEFNKEMSKLFGYPPKEPELFKIVKT